MRVRRGGIKGHRNRQKTRCPAGHKYGPETTYEYRGARQCKPCRKEQAQEWRAANPEQLALQQHRSYLANRETRLADKRRWRSENREQTNLASRLKKQRRRATGTLTAAEWAAILDRYGQICLACGIDGPLTVDHVIPISVGGLNTPDNVQPLCGPCNSSKGTKTIDYRLAPVGNQRS
jgi:5-methylcytosine-specific restriction endonuclease McrA